MFTRAHLLRTAIAVAVLAAALAIACLAQRSPREVLAGDPTLSLHDGRRLRSGMPFDGVVVELDSAERLRGRSPYRLGRAHGTVETWYENGQLAERRPYHDGVKAGRHQGFWPNGNPRFEFSFADGLYQGDFRTWYEDGSAFEVKTYQHGRETGRQQSFGPGGEVLANYTVVAGRRYGLLGRRPCFTVHRESRS